MSYLQHAASSAPDALLLSPRFWYVNRSLAGVGLCAVFLVVALGDLTYPQAGAGAGAGAGAIYLSLLIHGLAVWGLALSVRTAAKVEVDNALACCVETVAVREIGRIKGHLSDRIEGDRLEGMIPNNSHWDQGVIKLCQMILSEARDRKFHTLDAVTQPIRERCVGNLFYLQTLQRVALQLGILGTFIGLVWAIFHVKNSVLRGMDDAVLENLINSLHLSFGTSIAGLEVSVVLGLVLMALRRRQEFFFGNLEAAAAAFTQLARRMEISDEYLVEFEQIRNSMQILSERMNHQSLTIKSQTAEIETGLGQLSQLKVRFNEFLEDVRGEQAHVLSEMKSVYEIISPKRTAKELETRLVRAIKLTSESFQRDLQQGLAELDQYNESLKALREVLAEVRKRGEEQAAHLERGREVMGDSAKQLGSTLKRVAELHGNMLEQFENASKIDVEVIFADFEKLVQRSEKAIGESWGRRFQEIQRRLDDQGRSLRHGNALLEKLVVKPSFFESVVVRPLRAMRGLLVGS